MRFNRLLAATVACSIALGSTSFAAKIAKSTNSATTSEVTTEVTTVDSESTEATTMVDELSTETVSEETTEATTEATTETTTVNPFSDVDSSSAQGNAILKMYAKGLLSGYNDGTFKPDNNITRAEVARVFNNVFGYTLNSSATITDFTDNTDSSVWYYNDVRIAQSNGYINGFNDGSFQPKANMTREQACTIIYLAGKLPAPTTEAGITDLVSAWAKNAVEANIAEGVFTLEAGNTFRATANITRGELCEALAHFVTDDADAITTATTTVAASSESTTESTTTETTTKSSTSGSTGGGGGGGGGGGSSSSGSSTTTETTTESTTQDLSGITLDDAQLAALERVIRATKNEFIPRLDTSAQVEVGEAMLAALEAKYADPNYDVTADFNNTKAMYKALGSDEKSYFRTTAIAVYSGIDYTALQPIIDMILG